MISLIGNKNKQTNKNLIETENRLVVARGMEWDVGEMGESDQKVQTFHYKINNSEDIM